MTRYVLVLCTLLFSFRVGAQAWQHWHPVSWLPPDESFQGSAMPYGLLLASQLLILALMLRVCLRIFHGGFAPHANRGRALLALGVLYLVAMLMRLGIGIAVPEASPWFRAWLPTAFHFVLAAFLIGLARLHLRHAPVL